MCLAIPGQIVSIEGDDPFYRLGKIRFGGVTKQVSLAYVPEAKVGDYALVHAGFAINLVDESEALGVFELLKDIEDIPDESAEGSSQ
ncbi:MAG TPA: HypC/HybG/HupF family hydrogenase formation chaperone [Candidatus Omnitrophota bacterium]|nr:HypC/HybG/HupF family hydrogenase formation chaperone [Candidatus Omnitrophota bacterium]HPN56633.1 HypC/HybG/HupF family hydrogenase formation chaperone [Candidatus Omnitrophota bacterium]